MVAVWVTITALQCCSKCDGTVHALLISMVAGDSLMGYPVFKIGRIWFQFNLGQLPFRHFKPLDSYNHAVIRTADLFSQ